MRLQILPVLLLAVAGCAVGPEHRTLQAAGDPVELVEVPFFPQDDYQCGPAALATVLADSGIDIRPAQLTPQIYVPERRGSLQAELLAATRRHGRVPYLLPPSLAPILAEVRAGRPVLVFQNLGLERWPIWHYAVLVGFDPVHEKFLLRSGTRRRLVTRARSFLGSWDRAGRWSMVVASPSEPPADADILRWLQAIAPFESTGELDIAARGYEAAVERWPEDASAWTALGNVRYREQRLDEAATAYRRALELAPGNWVARNNLVQTLVDAGCPDRAREWADGVVAPPPEMAASWAHTLEALAAAGKGECGGL